MPEKKYTLLIGFGISVIIAIVITIFSTYSGKQIVSPETFGFGESKQTIETKEVKTYSELENVFVKLIESYNTRDLELLKSVDYRYLKKADTIEGKNYVEAIKLCDNFKLHKIITKNITIASINGYLIYSYEKPQNGEQKYVLNEFIVKSLDGKLQITYLDTVSTDYDTIMKYLQ
jgi:hypothetical protein